MKGRSAGGKSFLLQSVLKFVQPDTYVVRTGLSPNALAYGSHDLKHRHLVVYEAAGLQGSEGNANLRSLLSEGHLTRETTIRQSDGTFGTQVVDREGPVGVLMTTTLNALHPEDETRLLSLRLDDDADQTRLVLIREARARFS